MSLAAELRADQKTSGSKCTLCTYLKSLAPREQKEWRDVITDRSFSGASISRALMRRTITITEGTVERHRRMGHA